jgi:imidazoleglycerol phosphate dehydratase HisB
MLAKVPKIPPKYPKAHAHKCNLHRYSEDVEEDAAGAATVEVVMDLSNRPFLANGVAFRDEFIGDLSTEMIDHLFMSITVGLCTLESS